MENVHKEKSICRESDIRKKGSVFCVILLFIALCPAIWYGIDLFVFTEVEETIELLPLDYIYYIFLILEIITCGLVLFVIFSPIWENKEDLLPVTIFLSCVAVVQACFTYESIFSYITLFIQVDFYNFPFRLILLYFLSSILTMIACATLVALVYSQYSALEQPAPCKQD